MPVRPRCVSWNSACHFGNCLSLDKIRFVRVGPNGRWNPKLRKLPPRCRHPQSFRTLSWISASWLEYRARIFFRHLVPHVRRFAFDTLNFPVHCSGTRETPKKVIFLWAFSSFSLVMPVSHESEHVKRMTSQSPLIINLSRAGAAAERTGLGASVPAAADPGDSGRLNPHGLSRARLGQQKRGGARRMRAIGGPYAESGTDGLWLGCRCFGFKGTGPAGRRIGSRRRVGS